MASTEPDASPCLMLWSHTCLILAGLGLADEACREQCMAGAQPDAPLSCEMLLLFCLHFTGLGSPDEAC